ncbi:MAG: rplP [Candidatus Saganbacteria bacterium]|uniref:Large ribosomal subunit protein uL16 n=1 Tax=Candidatus Saganbacteria bacterium TaxID=2575572 RepID=A0A833NZZ9_UNCSA|nr:MAG: rplP [Candidatus Saganbacteria bacterium]
MVLQPTKTKFRKAQRGRLRGKAATGTKLIYGEFGLQAAECMHLKTNQIESARKAIMHYLKRGGKLWIRVLADKTYTSRPAETRMGGGKGAPAGYAAAVRPGHIIFEVAGVSKEDAAVAFRLAQFKLPLKTRIVSV